MKTMMMPSTDMTVVAQTLFAAAAMAPVCQFPSASYAPTSDPVSHVVHKVARTKKGRKGDRNAR
jgi:hypothetical protein